MEIDTESTTTSIDDKTEDFCENPTRDTLAEGLMSLLKPTIDQLDERVRATRISQVELKQQIEGLAEELKKISNAQTCALDLDVYVRKLMNAKLKVTVVSNILQTAQDRLNKVHFAIEKEAARRRALLEPSPLTTPLLDNLRYLTMPSFKILTPSLSHLTHKDYSLIYEPAEDSFLLLDALEDDLQFILQRKPVFCVEVGSGSGIVSAAIAQSLGSSAFCMAIDLNPVACFATCRTAASNNVQVDVIRGDLVHPLLATGSVDLLVFNPPYVPTPHCEMVASLDDPLVRSWAGGEHGREVMDRLFPLLPGLLAPQGLFYLVAIEDNDVQQIQGLLSNLGFHSLEVKKRSVRGENLVILRIERKNLRTETHTT